MFRRGSSSRGFGNHMCLPRVRKSAVQPTLGWKPVVALSVCNSAHFYSLCSIFSYAGFLAVDCGWAPEKDRAGYVAGLLPTAVLIGRLLTSIGWGYAADCIGRRLCAHRRARHLLLGESQLCLLDARGDGR